MNQKIFPFLLAVFLIGPINSTYAQMGRYEGFAPNLTKRDIDLAKSTAREEMEGKAPGTVLSWTNPKSGNTGTVRLVRNFTRGTNNCRQVVHVFNIKDKENQRWEFVVCQMKNGSWKWPVPPKRLK